MFTRGYDHEFLHILASEAVSSLESWRWKGLGAFWRSQDLPFGYPGRIFSKWTSLKIASEVVYNILQLVFFVLQKYLNQRCPVFFDSAE